MPLGSQERVTLAVATNNAGKLRELRALLAELPVDVIAARDALGGAAFEVVEDGETFEANALKKAYALASAARVLALADDSGLEVDALGGRPGVRSARFAHERATDAENNAALLKALEGVAPEARQARFRCVLALVDARTLTPSAPILVAGSCEGRIARSPRGDRGFGYDPLFLIEALGGRCMAELDDGEKNRLSHRGVALQKLLPALREALSSRRGPCDQAPASDKP